VLAVVVMVNYLSRDYFLRFHVSTRTRIELSPAPSPAEIVTNRSR